MREEVRTLTDWMEWGQVHGKTIPHIARALGEVADMKKLPPVALNMLAVMHQTYDALERIQSDWSDSDFFEFHLIDEHSPLMTPSRMKRSSKKGTLILDLQELMPVFARQIKEQDKCAADLGLPTGAGLIPKLREIYEDERLVDIAFQTIGMVIGCRTAMQELLTLLKEPAFRRLPNVEVVASSEMRVNLLENEDLR